MTFSILKIVKNNNVKHVRVANISYHNDRHLHLHVIHKLIGLVFHENVSFLSSKTILKQS